VHAHLHRQAVRDERARIETGQVNSLKTDARLLRPARRALAPNSGMDGGAAGCGRAAPLSRVMRLRRRQNQGRDADRGWPAAYFEDRIFSGHDLQAQTAPTSTWPPPAHLRADPTRCLVIEDTATGVRAGLDAGATVWGYCGDGRAFERLAMARVFRHGRAGGGVVRQQRLSANMRGRASG
jgi:hypothetical protein